MTSINYPDRYDHNFECEWYIGNSSLQNKWIELTFNGPYKLSYQGYAHYMYRNLKLSTPESSYNLDDTWSFETTNENEDNWNASEPVYFKHKKVVPVNYIKMRI